MSVKIDRSDHKLEELRSKYSNMLFPQFDIKIDGRNIREQNAFVSSLNVETSTERADSFEFSVFNSFDVENNQFKWVDEFFKIGKPIEIAIGYEEAKETVFEGYITAVVFSFPEDDSPLVIVKGMDISFKMMKGIRSFSWSDKKYSEIASEIAAQYTSEKVIDATDTIYEIIEQSRSTDYQFMEWMADRCNYEFFITGRTLFFRKPHKSKTPVIEVDRKKHIISLSIEQDIGDQIGAITIRGWDHKKKTEFTEKVKTVNKIGSGQDGASIIRELIGSANTEYIYSNEMSQEAAKARAEAILNRENMKLVSGNGEVVGIPEIMAGKYMRISGAGPKLDKIYYITAARHVIDKYGYRTSFDLGGNDI